eukprot:677700-Amphidinium_carterae.1
MGFGLIIRVEILENHFRSFLSPGSPQHGSARILIAQLPLNWVSSAWTCSSPSDPSAYAPPPPPPPPRYW